MFQDYLFFGADVEFQYAFRMAHLSGVAQAAQKAHQLDPLPAQKLAEALLGTVLLGSILDDEERLNLRFLSEERFFAAAEATRLAEIKGYFTALKELEGDDFAPETYHVFSTRSLRSKPGDSKVYESHSRFMTPTIEDALNDHIRQSYQMQSFVKLESWLNPEDNELRAFGVIYMELPNIREESRVRLWEHVHQLGSLKALYHTSDDPDRLAAALIPDKTAPVRSMTPTWKCTCSLASVEETILRLPEQELLAMEKDGKPVDVACHYCGTNYHVSLERIKELVGSGKVAKSQVPGVKH